MTADEIKEAQAGKMVKDLLSTRKMNVINDVLTFALRGIGQTQALNNGKVNMWYAYNAVTGYLTSKRYSSESDRMTSMMFGDAAGKIAEAGTLALHTENVKSLRKSVLSGLNLN
jgi:hypothetical protein